MSPKPSPAGHGQRIGMDLPVPAIVFLKLQGD
jgi:hypothetical protein